MVILKESEDEDISQYSIIEIKKRLYKVIGLNIQIQKNSYGVIKLRHHQEARQAKDVKSKNGPYKKGEDYRPAITLLHTQLSALVSGRDFEIDALGEITWKNHA